MGSAAPTPDDCEWKRQGVRYLNKVLVGGEKWRIDAG